MTAVAKRETAVSKKIWRAPCDSGSGDFGSDSGIGGLGSDSDSGVISSNVSRLIVAVVFLAVEIVATLFIVTMLAVSNSLLVAK